MITPSHACSGRPDQHHERQRTQRQDRHPFEIVDTGDGAGLPRDLIVQHRRTMQRAMLLGFEPRDKVRCCRWVRARVRLFVEGYQMVG
jgi:hypothetical protein